MNLPVIDIIVRINLYKNNLQTLVLFLPVGNNFRMLYSMSNLYFLFLFSAIPHFTMKNLLEFMKKYFREKLSFQNTWIQWQSK